MGEIRLEQFLQMRSCKDIFQSCKHRRGRSRYLLSVSVEIGGEGDAAPIAAKVVFVRNRSNRKDYLVLLSTDTSLTEDEVIQLYGKRWDIVDFLASLPADMGRFLDVEGVKCISLPKMGCEV